MKIELIEKLSAIREDLLALEALCVVKDDVVTRIQVTDPKKLAELVKEKVPTMIRHYEELRPYMTRRQRGVTFSVLPNLVIFADILLTEGRDYLSAPTTIFNLLADVSDLTENLEWLGAIADHMGCPVSELLRYKNAAPSPETTQ
jgi:hypothetical protein